MYLKPDIYRLFKLTATLVVLVVILECTVKTKSELPKDFLGLTVGMSRTDAQKRLSEIADFERDAELNQQLWKLKNDPHYDEIAIGFNRENRLRYITAFVNKNTAKERIRFTEIGDIAKARPEIVAPHYRYIWEVDEASPAYYINIYGDDPEFLTVFTQKLKANESEEEEEENE